MNVTCNNCKVGMESKAKRQSKGADTTTASDYRCPTCNCSITVFRKGIRQSEDITEDDSDSSGS